MVNLCLTYKLMEFEDIWWPYEMAEIITIIYM